MEIEYLNLFKKILDEPEIKEFPVKNVMEAPFPLVDGTTPIHEITSLFNSNNRAVIVNYDKDKQHIITVQDMMNAVGANNN